MANERGSEGEAVPDEEQGEPLDGEVTFDPVSDAERGGGEARAGDGASEPRFPPPPPGPGATRPFGDDEPPVRPRRSGAAAGSAAAGASAPGGYDAPSLGGEVSFGTWLRRQRELREIDLREIADKTKISLRYLKAMEQDRFEVLPAPVFARGFLREYSKYVGLNADEVVNYYLASHEGRGLEPESSEEVVDVGSSRTPVTRGAFMVLLLIVVAAGLVYFLVLRRSQEEALRAAPPPIAPPSSQSVVPGEAPPPPEPVLTAPLVVTLDFTQECWIEARVDGQPQVSRLFVAGESIQLEAEESVSLTLGNGGGVEVQVNNMQLGLDAESGELVSDLTIDLATVERLRQRSG